MAPARLLRIVGVIVASGFWPGGALAQPAKAITVVGTLTDEGIECQALRGDNGKLYTLSGDLTGLASGDRVRVRGTVAEISFCMQGTTIGVRRIKELK